MPHLVITQVILRPDGLNQQAHIVERSRGVALLCPCDEPQDRGTLVIALRFTPQYKNGELDAEYPTITLPFSHRNFSLSSYHARARTRRPGCLIMQGVHQLDLQFGLVGS